MSFPVQCDNCSKRFAAPDSYLGKVVPCPNCGNSIRCSDAANRESQSSSRSPSSRPRPKSSDRIPDQTAASIFSLSEDDLIDEPVADAIPANSVGSPFKTTKKKPKKLAKTGFDTQNLLKYVLPVLVLVLSFLIFATTPQQTKGVSIKETSYLLVTMGFVIATLGFGTGYFGRDGVWGFIDQKIFGGLAYLNLGITLLLLFASLVVTLGNPRASGFGLIGVLIVGGLLYVIAAATWRSGYSRVGGILFCVLAVIYIPAQRFADSQNKGESQYQEATQRTPSPEPRTPRKDPQSPTSSDRYRFPTAGSFQPFEPGIEKSFTLIGSSLGTTQIEVYAPTNRTTRKLSVVLIAPAGAYPLTGKQIADGDNDECLPYARAGFVAVNYSISGNVLSDPPPDHQLRAAMRKFREAQGGVENARRAIAFVRQQFPFADMDRLYTSGHSSAGTVSLLVAAKIPDIKACIAFAAVSDGEAALKSDGMDVYNAYRQLNPELKTDLQEFSPIHFADQITAPVFLFHDRLDQNVSHRQSERMAQAIRNSTLKIVSHSDHYTSMIELGLPAAVRWLSKLDGNTTTANELLASSGTSLTPEQEQALIQEASESMENLLAEAGVTPDGRFVEDRPRRPSDRDSKNSDSRRQSMEQIRAEQRATRRRMLEEAGKGELADQLEQMEDAARRRREAFDRSMERRRRSSEQPVPSPFPRATSRNVKLQNSYRNAEEAYRDQLAYFVAKPDVLDDKLRLWKQGKRPMTGFRMGIGIVSTGNQRLNVSSWNDIRFKLDSLGNSLLSWGRSEEIQRILGEWPEADFGSVDGFVMLGTVDNRKALKQLARARKLHGLLTIVTQKRLVAGNWRSSHRLYFEDLTGSEKKWNSMSVSERTPANQIQDSLNALTATMQVRYKLSRMPQMTREKVVKRFKSLDLENDNPHWLVLEFFKYHQDELITDKQAIGIFKKIAPELDGKSIITGDEERRFKEMKRWLR